jgi:hypothetical protein
MKLPDKPNEWGDVDDGYHGRYRQRWLPGAFGDLETIEGVETFRVVEDEWLEDGGDGIPARTIKRAGIVA